MAVITSTDQASRDRPAIALPDTAQWAASTSYAVGDVVWALNSDGVTQRVYHCTIAGTSAESGGPTGTDTAIVDGSVTWRWIADRALFKPYGSVGA